MSADMRFNGKVALITGSGRGIGLAMARALAMAGAAVIIQDIDFEVAKCETDQLTAEGHRAMALGGDLTDVTLPERLVDATVKQFGSLDILINNGAIQRHLAWNENSVEELHRQFDANLIVPIRLCQLAAPLMQKKKWGRIINLGSIQQLKGNEGMLPYSLSKMAIEGLTRILARKLARDQITVNCLAPGWVKGTWRNRHDFSSDEDAVSKGKHVPLGRIATPEDYVPMTLLLCSEAGGYTTGQTFHVDGGMSA
jgi:NAD(P)-dependent dehydrogenase (short-subunit alcohol dehydrogenase family)